MKTHYPALRVALALLSASIISASNAGEPPAAAAPPVRESFEKLKALAGEWTGQAGEGEKKHEVSVVYKITSNGSVVMETILPGTQHEMITMYYLEGDQLVLVHYCAVGNQPKMALKRATADTLQFDFAGGSNLVAEKDGHMHSLTMTFEGKDKLTGAWDYFKDGKKASVTKFSVTRKSSEMGGR